MSRVRGFLSELRRRKVVHTFVVYLALAWAGIEGVTTLGPLFGVPEWLVRVLVVVILLGLPVAVSLSWMFDFTPQGLRPDTGSPEADTPSTARGAGVAPGSATTGEGDRAGVREGPDDGAVPPISRPAPAPATALIGRDPALAEVEAMLEAGARIVTVTGPGGTGKTRFASALLDRLGPTFPGGSGFVSVAGVETAEAVMPFVAMAFDVADLDGRGPAEGLVKLFGDRRILLVLDNLEHVLDAATEVATLLAGCPKLQLLATSRSPLRIAGEREYALDPLDVPTADGVPLEDLTAYPAIELFVERARQVRPEFRLTPENADAVAGVCRRLDGLPLALELAAARVRVLDPPELLQRLEGALELLTSGARDLPERQRTLRGTIDWSHSLLNEREQRLFRRLAVFVDGWTQEAAEAVCYPEGEAGAALDEMGSLLEKGLVHRDETGRFGMLQTIRDFGREVLGGEAEEARALQERHAAYFTTFAERLRHGFEGNGQLDWMRRGGQEDGNLEAALDWLRVAAEDGDADAVEAGLQICGDLILYWHVRALHVRMKTHVDGFMKVRTVEGPTRGWVAAQNAVALVAVSLGEPSKAVELSREAYVGAEVLGDEEDLAQLPWYIGAYHLFAGNIEEADEFLALGVVRSRALGWEWSMAMGLAFHGMLASAIGDREVALARLEEAVKIQERIGDYEGLGVALSGKAQLAMGAGDLDESLRLYEGAREAMTTVGDHAEVARIMDEMAWCTLAAGQVERARGLFLGSLQAHDLVASTRGIGLALFGLSAVEVADDRADRGAVIAGAAEGFSEAEGVVVAYPWVTAAQEEVAAALLGLPPEEVERHTQVGRRMSVQEAVAYATHVPLRASATVARG